MVSYLLYLFLPNSGSKEGTITWERPKGQRIKNYPFNTITNVVLNTTAQVLTEYPTLDNLNCIQHNENP